MRTLTVKSLCSILASALLSVTVAIQGQTVTKHDPDQFLFPDFTRSKIAMKAGNDLSLILNYNVVTEKMVFLQKGDVYDMIGYGGVDTVYICGLKFIPSGGFFFQVAIETPVTLFIRHKGKVIPPPRPAAYGGTSEVSSSTYINNLRLTSSGETFRMPDDPNIAVKYETVYRLKTDDQVLDFASSKQLLKIIPDFKSELRQYIKKEKTEFNNPEEVVKLIQFYSSLR
jgi:hypothetical protein